MKLVKTKDNSFLCPYCKQALGYMERSDMISDWYCCEPCVICFEVYYPGDVFEIRMLVAPYMIRVILNGKSTTIIRIDEGVNVSDPFEIYRDSRREAMRIDSVFDDITPSNAREKIETLLLLG